MSLLDFLGVGVWRSISSLLFGCPACLSGRAELTLPEKQGQLTLPPRAALRNNKTCWIRPRTARPVSAQQPTICCCDTTQTEPACGQLPCLVASPRHLVLTNILPLGMEVSGLSFRAKKDVRNGFSGSDPKASSSCQSVSPLFFVPWGRLPLNTGLNVDWRPIVVKQFLVCDEFASSPLKDKNGRHNQTRSLCHSGETRQEGSGHAHQQGWCRKPPLVCSHCLLFGARLALGIDFGVD